MDGLNPREVYIFHVSKEIGEYIEGKGKQPLNGVLMTIYCTAEVPEQLLTLLRGQDKKVWTLSRSDL